MNVSEEIQPYDSDHTALVHALWSIKHKGWTLDDADEVASLIMRSKWLRAVRVHAIERAPDAQPSSPGPTHTEQESE